MASRCDNRRHDYIMAGQCSRVYSWRWKKQLRSQQPQFKFVAMIMDMHLSFPEFKLLMREVIPGELFRNPDKIIFNQMSSSCSYMNLCVSDLKVTAARG